MATIVPNVSSSQALITPGWPLVSVPKSNPVAGASAAPAANTLNAPGTGVAQQTAINQAGDQNNTSV